MKFKDTTAFCVMSQVLLCIMTLFEVESVTVKQSHLVINPICGMNERLKNDCAIFSSMVRTPMECAFLCNNNETCLGSSVSKSNECFLHTQCLAVISCDEEEGEDNYTHFVKTERPILCRNRYKWHFENNRCRCRDGWIGQYCHRLAFTCGELREDGYPLGMNNVTIDVRQDGSALIPMNCSLMGKRIGFIIALHRTFAGNFNRTWHEYVSGFNDPGGDFWIGLQNLYHITEAGYRLLNIYVYMKNYELGRLRRKFTNFHFTGSPGKYAMAYNKATTVGGSRVSLKGCLEIEQNVPFSTWDSDNDGDDSQNCASVIGAGWWYPSCNLPCNLHGFKEGEPLQGIDNDTLASHFLNVQLAIRTH